MMKPVEIDNLVAEGVRKQAAGDFGGAETLFRKALKADRLHPEANFRLGVLAHMAAEYRDAVKLLERASKALPLNESYRLMLANAYQSVGRFDEAEAIFLTSYDVPGDTPDLRKIAFNLMNLYLASGKFDKGLAFCDAAVKRFGSDDLFYLQKGRLLVAKGDADAALVALDAASTGKYALNALLAMAPLFNRRMDYGNYIRRIEAHPGLADNPELCAASYNAYLLNGRLEDSIRRLRSATKAFSARADLHSDLLRLLTASDAVGEKEIYDCAAAWGKKFDNPGDAGKVRFKNAPSAGRRIRLGVLSRTFRKHVTMTILRPLLPELAKRFDLCGYYDGTKKDEFTAAAKAACKVWRITAGLGEKAAAELIRRDELDVLIDISGHFNGSRPRILTYRPAPVVIHYADSSSSLGIGAVGYRFSDDISDPPERGDPYSSEKVLRLPHGFFLYKPLFETPDPGPCPFEKNGFVTFGNCTLPWKITPTALALWKAALEAVPDSRLVLARHEFGLDPASADLMMRRLKEAGLPINRCRTEARPVADFEHLHFYDGIDIALDATPYNGVTTTLDAMWSGVPVVSCRGERLISRMGSAFVERVGLGDLVVEAPANFGAVAAGLAANRERLKELRKTLRGRMLSSPLCDAAGMAADMERAISSLLSERAAG
jgi:predicted O-linked N-acetylglucosamine transferase (SPINDLY family)/Flp pilus assembly protein TadD